MIKEKVMIIFLNNCKIKTTKKKIQKKKGRWINLEFMEGIRYH